MPMLPLRRSSASEEASPKAPSVSKQYAINKSLSYGDTSTAKTMGASDHIKRRGIGAMGGGFTSRTADSINSKQKSESMKRFPSAF